MVEKFKTVIVGAGLSQNSGLTVARGLLDKLGKQRFCEHVRILEKSSSCGGRMATRRIAINREEPQGNSPFLSADTGAQFLTVREESFNTNFVQPMAQRGKAHVWSLGFPTLDQEGFKPSSDGHKRWASNIGMNGWLNSVFLEEDGAMKNSIRLNCKVERIEKEEDGLLKLIISEDNNHMLCERLVLTMPLPQALNLIGSEWYTESSNQFSNNLFQLSYQILRGKLYNPCICLLIVITERIQIKGMEAPLNGLKIESSPIVQWVASNNKGKGIFTCEEAEEKYPRHDVLTIHCTPEFSQLHYSSEDDANLCKLILDELESRLQLSVRDLVSNWSLKRWRYAIPVINKETDENLEHAGFAALSLDPKSPANVFICGDSFTTRPRAEAAFLSATKLANKLA